MKKLLPAVSVLLLCSSLFSCGESAIAPDDSPAEKAEVPDAAGTPVETEAETEERDVLESLNGLDFGGKSFRISTLDRNSYEI